MKNEGLSYPTHFVKIGGSNIRKNFHKLRIKPEDQWSCKRSPDYFPGINTTVKRENGATSIF